MRRLLQTPLYLLLLFAILPTSYSANSPSKFAISSWTATFPYVDNIATETSNLQFTLSDTTHAHESFVYAQCNLTLPGTSLYWTLSSITVPNSGATPSVVVGPARPPARNNPIPANSVSNGIVQIVFAPPNGDVGTGDGLYECLPTTFGLAFQTGAGAGVVNSTSSSAFNISVMHTITDQTNGSVMIRSAKASYRSFPGTWSFQPGQFGKVYMTQLAGLKAQPNQMAPAGWTGDGVATT